MLLNQLGEQKMATKVLFLQHLAKRLAVPPNWSRKDAIGTLNIAEYSTSRFKRTQRKLIGTKAGTIFYIMWHASKFIALIYCYH
jgi:hypothetical protein